jgi:Flp pilus assembly protein TadD
LRSTRVQAVLVIALATTLSVATIRRNEDYRSELALWSATVRSSPGKARPWVNLGFARQTDGDTVGAAIAYRCALAKSPGDVQASNNLTLLPESSSRSRPLADDCRLHDRQH